jgi:hypothetical protein
MSDQEANVGKLLEMAKRLQALSLSEHMMKQVVGQCEDIKTLSLVAEQSVGITADETVYQAADYKQPAISTQPAVNAFDNSLAHVIPRDHRIA